MIESEYSASTEDRKQYSTQSPTRTNTRIFAVMIIISQIAIGVLYGLLVKIPYRTTVTDFTNFTPIFLAFATYFLIIVGFGAIFAYERRLVWSAIGFNLLIVCLTVQWFFLFNYFWRDTQILSSITGDSRDFTTEATNDNVNQIFLSNSDFAFTAISTPPEPLGATITMALKAALANCVAFSFILGKSGPLQAFFVSWIGTFGFELNRNVITLLERDYGYTYTVFVYGGFLGFILGLILNIKYKGDKSTAKHPWYIGNAFAGAISFFGACVLFCFFPILAMDPSNELALQPHFIYRIPLSVWYTISAAVLVAAGGSILVNGKLIARDMINGVVAGGVCSLTASYYLANPVWSQCLGVAAGFLQMFGQSFIETKWARSKPIIATYSFTVFGLQGLLGGIWSSIFGRVILDNVERRETFFYDTVNMNQAGWSLLIAVITAGIAMVFGLMIGLLLLAFGKHIRSEHFHDYTYWVPDDGIRYDLESEQYVTSDASSSIGEYYVHEVNENVKNRNAYL